MRWWQWLIALWLPLLIAALMLNSGAHAGKRRKGEEELHKKKREEAWQDKQK